jgi:hypothetical protein
LQVEFHKIKSSDHQSLDISEEFMRNIVTSKKHLLHSTEDADKKEVLQEYVQQVVIQTSNDLSQFDAER